MLEPKILATVIKKHRKAAGLSQLQLAEMAGVGKTVVFDIEKGKETIQLDTLRKIMAVLNIKVQLNSPFMNQINQDETSHHKKLFKTQEHDYGEFHVLPLKNNKL